MLGSLGDYLSGVSNRTSNRAQTGCAKSVETEHGGAVAPTPSKTQFSCRACNAHLEYRFHPRVPQDAHMHPYHFEREYHSFHAQGYGEAPSGIGKSGLCCHAVSPVACILVLAFS